MWQRFNRGLYIHLSGKPPSSLEFHCPMTMAKLKAEIKLFVFVEYIRIFWPFFNPFQNFQKTRFCQPFTVDELDLEDFFCEEVRNAFASNWRDLNEDFEEFKEELLQLLLMKERVKKSCIEKWLRSILLPRYEHFVRKVVRLEILVPALSFQTYGSKLSRRYLLAFIDPSLNVSVEAWYVVQLVSKRSLSEKVTSLLCYLSRAC